MKLKIESMLFEKYREKKRNAEIEKYLVGAMYQTSSLSAFTPIEEIFKTLADSNYGPLSKEFGKVYNEIKKGASVEDAIESMIKRNNSKALKRALNLFVVGYKTGANISDALKEVADDTAETLGIVQERAAAMTIEKYTLFAGAIIVPLILGAMISLIQGLDIGSLADFGLGTSTLERTLILENATIGNNIYIAVYAVLASVFVGLQENKIENALVYLCILLPCSLFLFNLMTSINVLALF